VQYREHFLFWDITQRRLVACYWSF